MVKNDEGVFSVAVHGEQPEHVTLTFTTTGAQGGDTGHGGNAVLEFRIEGGDHSIQITDKKKEHAFEFAYGGSVSFIACGDWELGWLAQALVELGKKIEEELKRVPIRHRPMTAVERVAWEDGYEQGRWVGAHPPDEPTNKELF